MQSITRTIWIAALTLCLMGAAKALPITDVFTPDGGPVTLTTGNPYSFQHDLTVHGFDPLEDVLSSALLTLNIQGAGGQNLMVGLDGDTIFNDSLNALAGLDIAVAYLQSAGVVDVTLTKGGGAGSTFSFLGSTLFVDGTTRPIDDDPPGNGPPTAVPEPGMLMIFALGLLGLAVFSRRRAAREPDAREPALV